MIIGLRSLLAVTIMSTLALAVSQGAHAQTAQVKIDISGSIKPGTCSVDNENREVPLGDWDYAKFTGVGATTDWVSFSVVATCKGVKKITTSFTGTADKNDATLHAVTGGAAGVGIELTSSDNYSAAPGKSFTWGVGSGAKDMKMRARYRQTLAEVTSGKANAVATMALSYE